VKFSLASRCTFRYNTSFSSPNAVRNSAYGPQVRMSKLRSTPLCDTLPNRRNSSVPKLQCRGHRSEDLYVTSPTTSATTDKLPGKKALRDHRDFDRPSCGDAGQDQETKKMDGRFHRRAELADSSVRRVQRGSVFRGHFRSQGKEIRV
jgi:hypothetical protein